MAEKAGFKVSYVETGRRNIKLTTVEDVLIARAFYADSERSRKQKEQEG